jgi:hypothetical protein
MGLFAGLDISVKTTAVCFLDANSQVLLETMVDSEPGAIAECLRDLGQLNIVSPIVYKIQRDRIAPTRQSNAYT